jgi:BirA family biotin operon repressor/biotin-[acetyl-CoA-carboxylase] ligase
VSNQNNYQFNINKFDEVVSTNKLAFELVEANEAAKYNVITANRQTGGMGRLNREWESVEGNLFCSLILQFDKIIRVTDYSFLTACALGDVLMKYGIKTDYKWPNDIMLDGKKLAGILLQLKTVNNILTLVIGVGVNIVDAPSYAISLAKYNISKDEFLESFCEVFLELEMKYKNYGFKVVRNKWVENAYKINETIKLSSGQEGVFNGIDDEGNLLLENAEGIISKVFFEEVLG